MDQIATGLSEPRIDWTAPNGDLFVAESQKGQIRVLRGIGTDRRAQTFAGVCDGIRNKPFGIAFYPPGANPQFVYVANTDAVVRFPYQNGDLKARGAAQSVAGTLPGGGFLRGGGHWTRDIAFSRDEPENVRVGGLAFECERRTRRRTIARTCWSLSPMDRARRFMPGGFAMQWGLRWNPATDELWVSVNERDELGDVWFPITFRTLLRADFTAGRGFTSAGIRILGTPGNIRS